jgi:membrane associated rhomboid family serine protease
VAVCRRCEQPICTDCMREAPVGWQCARCVHRDSRKAPVTRWQPRSRGTLGATRLTPLVIAIVAINVVVFVIEETDFNPILLRFALIPALTPNEPYRLITAAFLHVSFSHIFLNMLALVIIGPALEAAVGKLRFIAVYLIAAFGGEVFSYLVGPLLVESVGASGAIFGVMGAYLVLARRRGWDLSIVLPLIGINLVYSFLDPAIDWRAHVGGLVIGGLLAFIFTLTEREVASTRRIVEPLACVVVLAVLVGLSRIPPGHIHL